ncbi:MAG TPA: RNB domain-containing ribonuclease [Burkholderiales bacterium]|nr:RNB domain-containing ribonuclease [Burkholderiales bacterium]
MNLLYEEEGEFKVGAVLAESPASYQVESLRGRRSKVKAANVVLAFERPSGAELLREAEQFAAGIDTEFLWQCSGRGEFGFRELAREYVGREPAPGEAAGVLFKLHAAPMYFHRRGRGRYQAAPAETLKLALAAIEKKRQLQERIAGWAARLERFECPPEVAALREELLYAPDRSKPETKAFEQACAAAGLSAARLLERCGLLGDSHAYHLGRFLHEFPAHRAGFAPHPPPAQATGLPLAPVAAFSLDDAGTTEIDDAFSVVRASPESLRVGIHIAAPALAFAPGSPLDAIARERLSTVYLPGAKYTMLPEDAVARLSLDESSERAVVSLYFDVGGDGEPRGRSTRLERVRIAANLRHGTHEALNEAFERGEEGGGLAFEEELRALWRLACALERRRGRPSTGAAQPEYVFRVEEGRVAIEQRRRGAPLDKTVAELMILANATWGELLAERDVAAIYRVQAAGKVRMSVHPELHDSLGVSSYAWFTSPLRRYVDLVNQWQLAAALRGERAPFGRNAEGLLAALRAYEVAAARYDEHQRALETYWCLRWLEQERVAEADALVLRENLVRFEQLPLALRVPSLPELAPGSRVRLAIGAIDLLGRTMSCTWRATLGQAQP